MKATPYTALDPTSRQIRLLSILPGSADSQICCTLEIFHLYQPVQDSHEADTSVLKSGERFAPDYAALSYTWGEATTYHAVLLNGHEVLVRQNLWHFLQTARQWPETRLGYLWIDLLCIDQANNEERMHQVGSMAHIYCQAREVVIWLGPASQTSDLAMEAMHSAQLSASWPLVEPDDELLARAILELCERRYWSRLWVLQELVSARSAVIMCGNKHLPLQHLATVLTEAYWASALKTSRNTVLLPLCKSLAFAMLKQIQSRATSLFDLVLSTSHLGCAEIRDKVYALLSIAGSGHDGIQPDYDSSLQDLLNAVLRNEERVRPPDDLMDTLHMCKALSGAFGINTILDMPEDLAGRTKMMEIYPLLDRSSGISLWWTLLYHHDIPATLWMQKSYQVRQVLKVLTFSVLYGDGVTLCRLLFGCTPQEFRGSLPWELGVTLLQSDTTISSDQLMPGDPTHFEDLVESLSAPSGDSSPRNSTLADWRQVAATANRPLEFEDQTQVGVKTTPYGWYGLDIQTNYFSLALFSSLLRPSEKMDKIRTLLLSSRQQLRFMKIAHIIPYVIIADCQGLAHVTDWILDDLRAAGKHRIAELMSVVAFGCIIAHDGDLAETPRSWLHDRGKRHDTNHDVHVERLFGRLRHEIVAGFDLPSPSTTTALTWSYTALLQMLLGDFSPRYVEYLSETHALKEEGWLGAAVVDVHTIAWSNSLVKLVECSRKVPDRIGQVKDIYIEMLALTYEAIMQLPQRVCEILEEDERTINPKILQEVQLPSARGE